MRGNGTAGHGRVGDSSVARQRCCTLGRTVGEAGDGDAGFGDPTRTTIFDYWGVPAHQRWMNGGRFDGGALSEAEKRLRDFYRRLMMFTANNSAMLGDFADIHSVNREATANYDDQLLSFVRWRGDERLVVVTNFATRRSGTFELILPTDIVNEWRLGDGHYALEEQLYDEPQPALVIDGGIGTISLTLAPLQSLILRVAAAD